MNQPWGTCVSHPEPSSLLPAHTIPLGCPSAPAQSFQCRPSNLDWRLVPYMILYEGFLFSPCYSLELCIQMGISFFFSLPLASLLFSAICKASSDNHFVFLHFYFLGMALITELPQGWENRLLEGTDKTLCAPGARRKEQYLHKRLIQTCLCVYRSLWWRRGSIVTYSGVKGTEYNSVCLSPFEGVLPLSLS